MCSETCLPIVLFVPHLSSWHLFFIIFTRVTFLNACFIRAPVVCIPQQLMRKILTIVFYWKFLFITFLFQICEFNDRSNLLVFDKQGVLQNLNELVYQIPHTRTMIQLLTHFNLLLLTRKHSNICSQYFPCKCIKHRHISLSQLKWLAVAQNFSAEEYSLLLLKWQRFLFFYAHCGTRQPLILQ